MDTARLSLSLNPTRVAAIYLQIDTSTITKTTSQFHTKTKKNELSQVSPNFLQNFPHLYSLSFSQILFAHIIYSNKSDGKSASLTYPTKKPAK